VLKRTTNKTVFLIVVWSVVVLVIREYVNNPKITHLNDKPHNVLIFNDIYIYNFTLEFNYSKKLKNNIK